MLGAGSGSRALPDLEKTRLIVEAIVDEMDSLAKIFSLDFDGFS